MKPKTFRLTLGAALVALLVVALISMRDPRAAAMDSAASVPGPHELATSASEVVPTGMPAVRGGTAPLFSLDARVEEVKKLRADALSSDFKPSLRIVPKPQRSFDEAELDKRMPGLLEGTRRKYARLLDQLKLSDADASALVSLLAERALRIQKAVSDYPFPESAMVTLQPIIDPATDVVGQRFVQISIVDRQIMMQINAEADSAVGDQIRQLLGANYGAYEEHEQTYVLRTRVVDGFASALGKDASLQPDQRQLSAQQGNQLAAAAISNTPTYDSSAIIINAEVVSSAKEILTPGQFSAFEKFVQSQNADAVMIQTAIRDYAAGLNAQ